MLLKSLCNPVISSLGWNSKTDSQAIREPIREPDLEKLEIKNSRQKFRDRSLFIRKDSSSIDPFVKHILDGNVQEIKKSFFPRQANEETVLIRDLIHALLTRSSHTVKVIPSSKKEDYQIEFNGKKYGLYSLLSKVKWDLIKLDQEELDQYEKTSYSWEGYTLSNGAVPKIHGKHHLYSNLHNAEKMAIGVYKSAGSSLNQFLRGTEIIWSERRALDYLIHIATLCSALNKIPPSVDGYLFRCMSDVVNPGKDSLVDGIAKKLKNHEKFKELGFTSMSLNRPLGSFGNACIKIYTNPFQLAKDISCIGVYENEFECLLLPNTKDLALREIVQEKESSCYYRPSSSSHYIITKLVSKRQGVF